MGNKVAMRTPPRGSAGWRLRPRKLDRQPFSVCLSSARAREVSASPRAKGNKKAHSHHIHVARSHGRLRLQ
jgi:hypothetical protein